MEISLTVDDKSFDIGHPNLVELIKGLEDIDLNQPLLNRLAHSPDSVVQRAVSEKPNLSSETVRFFLDENTDPHVLRNMMTFHLSSPGMTYEALVRVIEQNGDELFLLAKQLDQLRLDDEEYNALIELVVTHPNPKVRMLLAKNKNLPEEVLRRLSRDDDELVAQRANRSLALMQVAKPNDEQGSHAYNLDQKSFHSMSDLMLSNYRELERLYASRHEGMAGKCFHWEVPEQKKTGIDAIDVMTGGIRKGEVVLITGQSGNGVTSLMLNVLASIALYSDNRPQNNRKVVLYSLQHCGEELSMRMLSSESGVYFERMRMGQFTSDDWRKLATASGDIAGSTLQIIYDPDISTYEIKALCNKVIDAIDLIVIDRLDLMNPFEDDERRDKEYGEIMESIQSLAKGLDIPVLLTVSLSKQQLNHIDLRYRSRSLFDGADTVMHLERNGKRATLKMFKHISLPASSVDLKFDDRNMRFSSTSETDYTIS